MFQVIDTLTDEVIGEFYTRGSASFLCNSLNFLTQSDRYLINTTIEKENGNDQHNH